MNTNVINIADYLVPEDEHIEVIINSRGKITDIRLYAQNEAGEDRLRKIAAKLSVNNG